MSEPAPGAAIPMQSVANLRDLGGWRSPQGGTVRRGVVFRSARLSTASAADVTAMRALGLRTVVDLRTDAERTAEPDRIPPTAQHVVADVLGDSLGTTPAQLGEILADPRRANGVLRDGVGERMLVAAYRDFVTLPSAHAAYRRVFTGLLESATRPVLVHCTTGKDRTGWAAAVLLLILGVPVGDVMDEYLLTNAQLLPALQPVFDQFAARGGDPDLLRHILGVRPDYLQTALDEVAAHYGAIGHYFDHALGLGAAEQADLRRLLLEP